MPPPPAAGSEQQQQQQQQQQQAWKSYPFDAYSSANDADQPLWWGRGRPGESAAERRERRRRWAARAAAALALFVAANVALLLRGHDEAFVSLGLLLPLLFLWALGDCIGATMMRFG